MIGRFMSVAAALLLLAGLAGCNNNQTTTMPDTVPPLPGKPSGKDVPQPGPPPALPPPPKG